jgi:hypothetical protein
MHIRILPYASSYEDALRAFSARLGAGMAGAPSALLNMNDLLPKADARRPDDELFLAADENQTVRGMYILRHQDFWIRDCRQRIAYYKLPVSEGVINRVYSPVGVQLLLDALERQPLLYGLGMGGYRERAAQLLVAAGWRMLTVPFYFRVIHPAVFLRNIAHLRRSALCARLFDVLAVTGLGWLGSQALQAIHPPRPRETAVTGETVARFGAEADELWESCKTHYAVCAVRNRAVLDILYPADNKRFMRLEVRRQGRLIGWALLLDTPLTEHKFFGNMRLGSIADALAAPADAPAVVACARQALLDGGADLIVSNQSHVAWQKAMRMCGFLRGPSNFLLGTSPQLTRLLRADGREVPLQDMHFNRGDGDGPINL